MKKNQKKTSNESPWYYGVHLLDDPENPEAKDLEGSVGFVYSIENLVTQKKYIGKKLLTKAGYKQKKGKKKKIRKESDWKDYFGSNEELKEDVKKLGKSLFHRHIIKFCASKGEMSYWETHHQFAHQVLLSDKYYNSWIQCKIHKNHVKGLRN